MSNRTDFDNQAAEFLGVARLLSDDEVKARLERELNDAFVAGQEHEDRALRAALAEALDGWDENARALIDDPHHRDESRIAELRAKYLGSKA